MDIAFEHPFAEQRGGADTVRRLLRTALVAALFGTLAISGVVGAVGALASAPSGGFVHEAVSLATGTGTMFSLPALAPGETATRYATISSTGSTPSSVRLFADVSGTGLARFLTLTVTRGTGGKDAFVPDGTDRGAGPGIVFRGRLSDFPRTWSDGVDLDGVWGAGESRTFRFEITLSTRTGAQGLTAGADFRWEGRSA